MLDKSFIIKESEINLNFKHEEGCRQLSYRNQGLSYDQWRIECKNKLKNLVNIEEPDECAVHLLRETEYEGIRIQALVMQVSDQLSIPAYLLLPNSEMQQEGAVIAIHGHGEVDACIGLYDDYHHKFALELAKAGHLTLCPELRGFGVLSDLSRQAQGYTLDYWHWGHHMAYSLVTDALQKGYTLIGETVEDLLRWEKWLINQREIKSLKVAGISYGGDLALIYPVFSEYVNGIFASGTLGSFSPIFSKCYNAPAHCIPSILKWMDRSDIAGLNAPKPMVIHYGELDKPSGDNFSASYNETVETSFSELQEIYKASGHEQHVRLVVSAGKEHEIDIDALKNFFKAEASD